MDTLPVTLIVKTPNQQFDDQTIKCELTWSIRRLKGYLSEVYPCKPSLEEQKLIYSGQLLNDAHILKDVLRQYEGQETHTVHLVYTPKNRNYFTSTPKTNQTKSSTAKTDPKTVTQASTPAASSSDGLRQRNVPNATSSMANQSTSQSPFMSMPSQPFMPGMTFSANQSQSPLTAEQYAMAQQMAMQNMMQQMYLQYMNYYANVMQANGQQMPAFNFPQSFNGSMPGSVPVLSQSTNASIAEQPPQQVQQQAAAHNADDEAESRDWLEILYTFSRLIVLLSLVYFYSSPGRCSIVILVMVLYYFYQNYQRNLRERQAQLAADVANANAAGDADEVDNRNDAATNAETPSDANVEPSPAETETTSSSSSLATTPELEENNRLPTVTLLRTFVLSFFASLIPETPAV